MTTDEDRPAILSIDLHLSIVPIAFLSTRNDSAFKEIGDSLSPSALQRGYAL
jgi:hypothetical protein